MVALRFSSVIELSLISTHLASHVLAGKDQLLVGAVEICFYIFFSTLRTDDCLVHPIQQSSTVSWRTADAIRFFINIKLVLQATTVVGIKHRSYVLSNSSVLS